jgi:hypothetical protein
MCICIVVFVSCETMKIIKHKILIKTISQFLGIVRVIKNGNYSIPKQKLFKYSITPLLVTERN